MRIKLMVGAGSLALADARAHDDATLVKQLRAAGAVILLVWLWVTNLALLFGIELDAEIERTKELKEGVPRADKEIQLDARATPKDKQTT